MNKSSYDQYNMRAKFTHKINNIFKLNMNLAGSVSRSDLLEETSTSLKVLRTAREEQPWYSPYKEDGTSYKVNGTDITPQRNCRTNMTPAKTAAVGEHWRNKKTRASAM